MNDSAPMTAQQIIAQLSTHQDGSPFPTEVVRAAMAMREEITPLLLSALEKAAADVSAVGPDDIIHFYAMYLLAQFRE
ncbi:MAG: DUF1186 domain-containing protein, partial [Verrucomicrobiota bacterium]